MANIRFYDSDRLFRKTKKIPLLCDGSFESISKSVREYAADIALKRVNRETVALLLDGSKEGKGIKYLKVHFVNSGSAKINETEVVCSGWTLHNLSYYIIKYGSDYRSKKLESKEEIACLLCSSTAVEQKIEEDLIKRKNLSGEELKAFYLTGAWGEQMLYQVFPKHVDTFVRELYILLSNDNDNSDISISEIVKKETNFDWDVIINNLQIAWITSLTSEDLHKPVLLIDNFETYSSILEIYTTSYEEIKIDKENYGRQRLFITPFVKTSKGEIISVNVFLNMFLIDHCIFWTVRNYYKKQKSQFFTNYFGELFEKYFKELLAEFLEESEYSRIERDKRKKRADWELLTGKYSFLIEQKSAVLYLAVKQQIPDIEKIKKFYKDNIVEACKQLRETEIDFNRKYIKIILLYDDYIMPGMLMEYLQNQECSTDYPYWILTIDEMEMLLDYCKNNREGFNNLIKEKIALDKANKVNSIEKMLDDRGIRTNNYLRSTKFEKYRELYKNPIKR